MRPGVREFPHTPEKEWCALTQAAIEKQTEFLRALPGDDVRQILWRFADRFDLQMLVCEPSRETTSGRSYGGLQTSLTCRCWCNRCERWPAGRWRGWWQRAPGIPTTGRRRSSPC